MPTAFELDQKVSLTPPSDTKPDVKKERELIGDDEERATTAWVLERHRDASSYRSGYYEEVWDEVDRAYYGIKPALDLEDPEREFRSNVYMRHVFVQVESATASIVNSLLQQMPPVTVMPNPWTETRAKRANSIERLLRTQFLHQMNGVSLLHRVVKQGERYGISPFLLRWKYEVGHVTRREPIFNNSGNLVGFRKLTGKAVKEDRPDVVILPTKNTWWNPSATHPDEDLEWIIYTFRKRRSWFELQNEIADEEIYKNLDKLTGSFNDMEENTPSEEIRTGVEKEDREEDDPLLEVMHFCNGDRIIEIGNRSALMRDRDGLLDSGRIPLFWYRATEIDNDFVGMGSAEPVLDLSDESNAKRNQRLDNVNRCINKQIFVGHASGLEGDRITFTPGGVHRLVDVNQVKEFDLGDVTGSAYIEQDRIDSDIDATTGNFGIARGENEQKGATATATATRTQKANLRTDLKVKIFMPTMGQFFQEMYGLNKQFTSRNTLISILGENHEITTTTTNELFEGKYDFIFKTGGFLGSRIVEQQTILTLIQQVYSLPGVAEQIDPKKLITTLAKSFNMPEFENVIRDNPLSQAGINRDPKEENIRFLLGETVIPVLPGEDHTHHISDHLAVLDDPQTPEEVRKPLGRHISDHQKNLTRDFQTMGAVGGAMSQMQGGMPQGGAVPPPGIPQPTGGGTSPGFAAQMASRRGGLTMGGANAQRVY